MKQCVSSAHTDVNWLTHTYAASMCESLYQKASKKKTIENIAQNQNTAHILHAIMNSALGHLDAFQYNKSWNKCFCDLHFQ